MRDYPVLSSGDRGQENPAVARRELLRQAYTPQPDFNRVGSEQAQRPCPKMTNEGLLAAGRVQECRMWPTRGAGTLMSRMNTASPRDRKVTAMTPPAPRQRSRSSSCSAPSAPATSKQPT